MIVLASGSAARAELLRNAGVVFEVVRPGVDEGAVKASLAAEGLGPREVADALAESKARKVSQRRPGPLVLGADQTVDLDGERMDKAVSLDDARAKLSRLRGRTHRLHSAVVVAHAGEPIWRETRSATLTMRAFSDAFLEDYLARVPEAATEAAGGYHYEALGVQLFARVEGDDATIRGLPLLGLLDLLRRHGELAR